MKCAAGRAGGVFCCSNEFGEPAMAERDDPNESVANEDDLDIAGPAGRALDSMMPLDFMLSIMRDPKAELSDRKWAASQAAPYCHARLSTERGHESGVTHEEILDLL